MDTQTMWQATLGELELTLSRANFSTWFKNTFIISTDNDTAVIAVPNTITKAFIEKKYHLVITKTLQKISENKVKKAIYQVELRSKVTPNNFTVAVDAPIGDAEPLDSARSGPVFAQATVEPNLTATASLNPRYLFKAFVIGKANELAHAASQAVSQKPGAVYNPLFIYGGVGLGKTHLMQAIGHQVAATQPDKKVLYVSCEKFTNEFIKSISGNRVEKFKDIYRSVDVLLIDDIQFLAGKEGIQEIFFHTFNDLHQSGKQIVITSDRPPKAIPALEQRLVSRFEWGMLADIASPDMETRAAILRAKLQERQYELESEIIAHIAAVIQNNVRELEGALNKIIANHQLTGVVPTLENVKKILSAFAASGHKKSTTPKHIISTVAEFYDVPIDDLMGACRKKTLANPRQIIMYLLREELKNSYPSIGAEIGNRDHTTAMHAYLKISHAIDSDEKIAQDIRMLRERLYNS